MNYEKGLCLCACVFEMVVDVVTSAQHNQNTAIIFLAIASHAQNHPNIFRGVLYMSIFVMIVYGFNRLYIYLRLKSSFSQHSRMEIIVLPGCLARRCSKFTHKKSRFRLIISARCTVFSCCIRQNKIGVHFGDIYFNARPMPMQPHKCDNAFLRGWFLTNKINNKNEKLLIRTLIVYMH